MELAITWTTAGLTVLASVAALGTVVLLTRLNGLRSFAKMAPFDFAVTIAVGSALAATAAGSVPLAQGLVALASLYGTQRLVAVWRQHGGTRVVDNAPMLLMVGERVLWDHMAAGRVTEGDLLAKLREANVLRLDQVRAVVLEATGDIAVLHAGSDDDTQLEPVLLGGLRGRDAEGVPAAWRDAPALREHGGAMPTT